MILSEFCANAGYNRKYAIRLLNGPRPGKWKSEPRRGRGVSYSQEMVGDPSVARSSAKAVFRSLAVWEAAGYPWSMRLKALLPLWMPPEDAATSTDLRAD